MLIHFYREDAVFRGKERWGWEGGCPLGGSGLWPFSSGDPGSPGLLRGPVSSRDVSSWRETYVGSACGWSLQVLPGRALPVSGGDLFPVFIPAAEGLMYCGGSGLLPWYSAVPWDSSQGIYGFFMGLALVWAMERTETVKARWWYGRDILAGLLAAAVNLHKVVRET